MFVSGARPTGVPGPGPAARMRRGFTLSACLIAMLVLLGAVPAGRASASKVELTDEGIGVESFEPALIDTSIVFAGTESGCDGLDEGLLGKNPAGTVKIAGSGLPELNRTCHAGAAPTSGTITIKTVDLSFSGAVKVKLVATVETGATCHYETKGLAGTQLFGVEISGTALTGTAKLQKNPKSPPTCAKTVAVEALLEAAPPAGEAFTPRLV